MLIFITNEIEQLTPFVKSRFDKIEFNYREDELKQQKINYINNYLFILHYTIFIVINQQLIDKFYM